MNPLQQRTGAVEEKISTEIKRRRRSNEQLLEDNIASIYSQIQARLNEVEDKKQVLNEIFDALMPIIQLEETYRGKMSKEQVENYRDEDIGDTE